MSLCEGEDCKPAERRDILNSGSQQASVHTLVAHRCSWEGSCREIFPDFDFWLYVLNARLSSSDICGTYEKHCSAASFEQQIGAWCGHSSLNAAFEATRTWAQSLLVSTSLPIDARKVQGLISVANCTFFKAKAAKGAPLAVMSVGTWDVSAVTRWLESIGFEEFAAQFAKEKIDGEVLQSLTMADLQQLKMPLGQAKKLLEFIVEMKAHQRMSQPRSTWSAGDAKRLPPLLGTPDVVPESNCVVILLMGPPGSGKSTIGGQLAEILGGEHFDLGVHLRRGSKAQPTSLLINFIYEAMEKGKKKMGSGPHFAFVNGYPRMMDGFNLWEELDKVLKPSLVMVLEAPDDILQVRLMERARKDEQSFEDRMAFYRAETDPVITAYHDLGRTRFIDAFGHSINFVVASALFHLQTTVVFACGEAEKYGKVCDAVLGMGLPHQMSCLNVDEMSGSSEAVVGTILSTVKAKPGQVVLLKGFPRNKADLQAWRSVEVLLVLDFDSGMDFSGYFSRRFYDGEPSTVDTIGKLLQSCQPLHVAVPFAAIASLRNWMDSSRYARWWDTRQFETFLLDYVSYIKGQVNKHKNSPSLYVRPSECPSLGAWLVWLTHLLHADSYGRFCDQYLKRTVGPLPPPISSGLTKSLPRKQFERFSGAEGFVSLEPDALVSTPLAFVDGLASIHRAGLHPLGDPRALTLDMYYQRGVSHEVMKLLGLFYRRFLIIMGEAGEDSKAGEGF